MSVRPLVSIVTPSLNQGKYIRQTIKSVLSQDFCDFEYWVIDGGSTDETLSILREYEGHIYWVSEPDNGQANAINKGWRYTKGEIISWLNSDDLLAPGAIRRAVDALCSDPHLAGVYGDCVYINDRGIPLGKHPSRPYSYEELVIKAKDFIPQPGTFLRRHFVEQVGMLDENLHYVMDYDLWLRLGMYAPFKYLPFETSFSYVHKAAKRVANTEQFGEELFNIFLRLVEHPDFPPELAFKKKIILANASMQAASYYFWGGDREQALHYLRLSWHYYPFPREYLFWFLFSMLALGKSGLWIAQKAVGNPFNQERKIAKKVFDTFRQAGRQFKMRAFVNSKMP